jgi:hypothetical protein
MFSLSREGLVPPLPSPQKHDSPASLQLSFFLGSMGIMEGRSAPQIRQKFLDLFRPAILTNWSVWPFAQVGPCPPSRAWL